MTKVIIPDVSRHVHFFPDDEDTSLMVRRGSQPLHAIVIFVINERTVNLSIIDHDGFFHTRIGVKLVQPGDALPGGSYCQWMPYQVNQGAPISAGGGAVVNHEMPKSDGPISGVIADLLATTATSLQPTDLAGSQVGADMTPAAGDDNNEGHA